jgi:hypothetical protein
MLARRLRRVKPYARISRGVHMGLDAFNATIGAAAVAVGLAGTIVAWRGVSTWRAEMIGRRRAELAEETLARFYEARDHLAWVRNPLAFAGEGRTREPGAEEAENERADRDAYYVPVERITKKADFWASFDASRYRFQAVFGTLAAEPFDTVRNRRHAVTIAAGALIRHDRAHRHVGDRAVSVHNEKLIAQWEDTIGHGTSEADQIAADINAAVSAMEAICRPAIDGFYRAQRRRWWQ